MTKSGFDLDEIERMLAAATPGDWEHYNEVFRPTLSKRRVTEIQSTRTGKAIINWQGFDGDQARKANWNAALIVALHNSAPAMLTEIRELRAENARLRHHWAALDKAMADNIIETDQPHRVRWEGEWHYGPLADAYFAMTSVVRKLARAALGEPQ